MSSDSATTAHLFAVPTSILRSGHGITWLSYVGLAEQMQAAEFRQADDALHFAAQHSLMRVIAATALGVRPTQAAEIPVHRSCLLCTAGGEHGKPRIEGINFNMARTPGLAVGVFIAEDMALEDAAQLGVDVERLRGSFFDTYDRISLTQEETAALKGEPQETAQMIRLMLWTGKQAVLKAVGAGLPAGLNSVRCSMDDFPRSIDEVSGFTTTAVFERSEVENKLFHLTWLVQGEYFIAVALDRPRPVSLHAVTTPVEIKRVLEPR